jgi:hypothetical protein
MPINNTVSNSIGLGGGLTNKTSTPATPKLSFQSGLIIAPKSNKKQTTPAVGIRGQQTQNLQTSTPQAPQENNLFAIPGENYTQYQNRVSGQKGNIGNTIDVIPSTPSEPTQSFNPQIQTYPGLVSTLASTASQPNPAFNQSIANSQQAQQGLFGSVPAQNENVKKATQDIAELQKKYAEQEGVIGNSPVGLSVQGGEQALLNKLYATKLSAAETALQNALTGNAQTQAAFTGAGGLANAAAGLSTGQQQAQQSGLSSAAGFAQPQLAGFNQQAFNPLTGQFQGGTNLQDVVGNVAQRVQSGNMTYQDAQNALSGYGQAGQNALLQALGTNFNIAQSNTLSAQQGSIGPNYQLADAAITNLENAVKNLNPLQSTNIPLVNAGANFLSNQTGFGGQQTREFTQAVQSARNAYAALLASVKGGTPTDYSGQAMAEVPDNPTPNDIAALRHSFEVLGQARKDIFGNPGQAGQQTNATNSNNLYNF